MTPMPTNDVAVQVAAPKVAGSRGLEKLKGGSDAAANAVALKSDRPRGAEKMQASDRAGKAADKVETDDASFDAVVDQLDDNAVKPETEAAVMDIAVPPTSTLSQELVALFQGAVASASQGEIVAQNAVKNAIKAATSGEDAQALANIDVPEADVVAFANSLPDRSETFALLEQGAINSDVRAKLVDGNVPDGAKQIPVDVLKSKTGFDAPVAVKSSREMRFQDAVPLQTSIGAFVSAREINAEARNAVGTKLDNVATSQSVTALSPEGGRDPAPSFTNGQSSNSGDDNRWSGERSSRDLKSERSVSPAKSLAGTLASVALSSSTDVVPPYQQIRAAVSEAIFVSGATQRTDYVSMYADRPALSNPTLKTLEISLSPPDLGRVNVKMNLASRDLKLEIEASKASTAQMLANDQAALKRELLSDNFEISSVLVSVTNAVSDTSASANLNGGDQQSSANGRASGQEAFSSMAGGREERRQQHGSAFHEAGVSPQQRNAELESSNQRIAGNALYI